MRFMSGANSSPENTLIDGTVPKLMVGKRKLRIWPDNFRFGVLGNLKSRKVLQAAVDWNLLEQNPARGIRIGDRTPKKERLYLNPREAGQLLTSLPEPGRTLVLVAVLTGLRIGEILALRWKAVDLTRGVIQVRETVSEGKFGFPKTKSSRRDIPISLPVRDALQAQITDCRHSGLEDLVFATRKQTPLNPVGGLQCAQLRPCFVVFQNFRGF
jgi:integrase